MAQSQEKFEMIMRPEMTIKVGSKERVVAVETAMVVGGNRVMDLLRDVAFASAIAKARNGNYRAAVEIIGLAAHTNQVKSLTPPNGGAWTKARVAMLAELALSREPGKNGYSKNQMRGRLMAHEVQSVFGVKEDHVIEDAASTAPATDPLAEAMSA